MKIKKITAIAGSVLMAGLTIASAAAAAFPAPFVDNGKADVAIVYGAAADSVAATNVHTALGTFAVSEGAKTVIDGESYKVEKTSTFYHLGDNITSVVSPTIDNDELPTLLADGTYTDDSNNEFDYTQEVTLESKTLEMFADNDYNDDEPTIGFHYNDNDPVLSYKLDFTDQPLISELQSTDLMFMGKEYYVLSTTADASKLTLLDSATSTLLDEDETATVDGKSISIDFVGSNQVKLTVDGETTNVLAKDQTYKLSDGAYIGIKDILYSSKDTGVSKVEFSIGQGKLVLQNGQDVELNEDSIDGLTSTVVNSSLNLVSISLDWNSNDEQFVTETSSISMPGFEALKLSYTGINYPVEEKIVVENDGKTSIQLSAFPLKDSTEDINLFYANDNSNIIQGLGKDGSTKLVTAADNTNMTFNSNNDEQFVVSWSDGNDAESYLMRATNFKTDNSVDKVTIQYRNGGSWTNAKTDRKNGDSITVGNTEFNVWAVNNSQNTVLLESVGSTNFNTLYSKEGMKVLLPVDNRTTASDGTVNATVDTSYTLIFREEDKDDNIASGAFINLTLGFNTANETSVSTVALVGSTPQEEGNSNVFDSYSYSDLATQVKHDRDPDQRTAELTYHGSEVSADVYITSADSTTTTSSATTDFLPVMASEIDNVKAKNLVIVGGSCINSAAATVLGGAYCGDAFTAATGVAANEFLIKGVEGAFTEGKLALVVAGYEAADTAMAVTYLTKKDVDTSSDAVYTSATDVTLVQKKA